MENNTSEIQTLTDLKFLFRSYDDKFKHIDAILEESIAKTLTSKIRTQTQHMELHCQKSLLISFGCVLIIMLVYKPFIHGWQSLLPYIAILLSCIANTIATIFEHTKIKRINQPENDVITNLFQCDKYLLLIHHHHLWSMYIGIPIVLFAVPQFCAILKGWNFYEMSIWKEPYHLFVFGVAVLAGIVAEIWYYKKTKNNILALKENITQYNALLNNK